MYCDTFVRRVFTLGRKVSDHGTYSVLVTFRMSPRYIYAYVIERSQRAKYYFPIAIPNGSGSQFLRIGRLPKVH